MKLHENSVILRITEKRMVNMNEKLEILGFEIDNLSVDKSMERVEEFLQTDSLSIIGIITPGILIEAEQSQEYGGLIGQLNLSIIGNKEILEAAGGESEERFTQIQDNSFMKAFLNYLIQKEMQVVLLADKMAERDIFYKYIYKKYPQLNVTGVFILEDAGEDDIVNLINGVSADVLLSMLSSPYQEEFVFRNRQKLGAKLWVGLGKEIPFGSHMELKPGFLGRLLEKRVLKKKISRYQSEKGD